VTVMTASMLDAVAISDFGWSGSEASDMLSADTVVGGVELMDVEFEEAESVGSLLVKLDPHSSSESSSAIIGVASMAAIVVAMVVNDVVDMRRTWWEFVQESRAAECRNANAWDGASQLPGEASGLS
jgi:hypothetical protein